MRGIRMVTAGAALMATVVCAAAQDTPPTSPGKPIQLLQILEKPDKAAKSKRPVDKSHVTKKTARHKTAKKSARAKTAPAQTPVAAGLAPEPWLPESASVLLTPEPDVVEVAGQAVKVALPDDVNEIDLTADKPRLPPPTPDLAPVAASRAEVTASPEPAAPGAPRGGWSWIAEALAALGGAVAAASAAWFLIGSSPGRRYG